jgi:hypothetical protein
MLSANIKRDSFNILQVADASIFRVTDQRVTPKRWYLSTKVYVDTLYKANLTSFVWKTDVFEIWEFIVWLS